MTETGRPTEPFTPPSPGAPARAAAGVRPSTRWAIASVGVVTLLVVVALGLHSDGREPVTPEPVAPVADATDATAVTTTTEAAAPGTGVEVLDTVFMAEGATEIRYDDGALWANPRDGTSRARLVRIDAASGELDAESDVAYAISPSAPPACHDGTSRDEDGRHPCPAVPGGDFGLSPDRFAIRGDDLWAASRSSQRLVRVDADTLAVGEYLDLGGTPVDLLTTADAVWVLTQDHHEYRSDESASALLRIDPDTTKVTETLPVDDSPVGLLLVGDLLVIQFDGIRGIQVDPTADGVDSTAVDLVDPPIACATTCPMVAGPDSLWVVEEPDGTGTVSLLEVDPVSHAVVQQVPLMELEFVESQGVHLAAADGAIWVVLDGPGEDSVIRIDTATHEATDEIALEPVATVPTDLAAGDGRAWVLDGEGALSILGTPGTDLVAPSAPPSDQVGGLTAEELLDAEVPFANCDGSETARLDDGYFKCNTATGFNELWVVGSLGDPDESHKVEGPRVDVGDLDGDGLDDGALLVDGTGFRQQVHVLAGGPVDTDHGRVARGGLLATVEADLLPDQTEQIEIHPDGTLVVQGVDLDIGGLPTESVSISLTWDAEAMAPLG